MAEYQRILQHGWENLQHRVSEFGRQWAIQGQVADAGYRQMNSEPVLRGRKLVLNYTDGSPCPSPSYAHNVGDLSARKIIDDDDEDEDDDDDDEKKKPSKKPAEDDNEDEDEPPAKKPTTDSTRRKNTIISLLCTTDPLAPQMALSFVGSPDSCTYIFEARSPTACGGIEKATQQLGPGGVFGVIALIAVLVYVVGGCVYQRTVMHQRGWRQLPNYSMWAGIGSFFYVSRPPLRIILPRSVEEKQEAANNLLCRISSSS